MNCLSGFRRQNLSGSSHQLFVLTSGTWDVFLFQLDRKDILVELLRFCLRNPDKQFIFIFISLQVNEMSFQRNNMT